MKTIWKFPLFVDDRQVLHVPQGAELLCVQVQDGTPCLWAVVEPNAPLVAVRVDTFGTGHPFTAEGAAYVGTYQLRDGDLVFHVFAHGAKKI